MASTYLETKPRFSFRVCHRDPSYYKHPPDASPSNLKHSCANTGFKSLLGTQYISHELVRTLEEIISLGNVLEESQKSKPSAMDTLYFTDKRAQIEEALQVRCGQEHPTAVSIRVVATMYTNTVFRQLPHASAVHNKGVLELNEWLVQTDLDSYWGNNIKVLLWILFVAGPLTADAEKALYATLIAGICRNLDITTWSESHQILREFLWSDETWEAPCKLLWSMVAVQL